MTLTIPKPTDFNISPKYGFLSPQAPPTQFRDPYYKPWDEIGSKIPSLASSGKLAQEVSKLPLLYIDKLTGDIEYRRAYVILGFLTHAYVWSSRPPNEVIPVQISEPFVEVCRHLRMGPVLSYAGLCTWNWQIYNGGGMDLESMRMVASFTDTRGEAAFYHIPVLIEYEGGHLMHLLLDAVKAAAENVEGWKDIVAAALNETIDSFARMGKHLAKFHAVLDAHFFYHDLRPFLAGGKGMEEKGLPRGMVFKMSSGEEKEVKLAGGSAAMSSLFPFLDYVLGVKHQDETVFKDMRQYMPGLHRDFLDAVSLLPSLRDLIISGTSESSDTELKRTYDECLKQMRSWRGKHIAIVSKYIVQPAREAERAAQVDKLEVNGVGEGETEKEWELQGTGGSALIPFLRGARDDTVGISSV